MICCTAVNGSGPMSTMSAWWRNGWSRLAKTSRIADGAKPANSNPRSLEWCCSAARGTAVPPATVAICWNSSNTTMVGRLRAVLTRVSTRLAKTSAGSRRLGVRVARISARSATRLTPMLEATCVASWDTVAPASSSAVSSARAASSDDCTGRRSTVMVVTSLRSAAKRPSTEVFPNRRGPSNIVGLRVVTRRVSSARSSSRPCTRSGGNGPVSSNGESSPRRNLREVHKKRTCEVRDRRINWRSGKECGPQVGREMPEGRDLTPGSYERSPRLGPGWGPARRAAPPRRWGARWRCSRPWPGPPRP